MPPPVPLVRSLIVMALAAIMMGLFAAMLLAWAWAIRRLREGRPLLPTTAPRVVPWGGGSVLAGLVAWISVSFSVSGTYAVMTGRSTRLSLQEVMLLNALINAILLVVVPLILRRTARARLEDFGLAPPNRIRQDALVGFVAFLLIAPIVYGIQFLALLVWKRNEHPLELMMLEDFSARVAVFAFLSAVVLAPAVEELLFRGLIQGWMTRLLSGKANGPPPPVTEPDAWEMVDSYESAPESPTRSRWFPQVPASLRFALPVVLTSALFAMVHLPQWPAPVAIFLLSLGLGMVYLRTGSLVASFVMHALFNGLSTLALCLVAINPPAPDKQVLPLPPPAVTSRSHAFCPQRGQMSEGSRAWSSRNSHIFFVGAGSIRW